jgi:sulfite exporter TauE/SafE
MPCGLVYAALGIALASGSPVTGALAMIAFGVGTLPALLMMGMFGARLGSVAHRSIVRRVAGLTILLFGLFHVVAASAQAVAPRSIVHACCLAKQARS